MAIGRTLSDFLNEISMKYRGADAYRWYENDQLCCRTYKELNQDSRRIASYLTGHFGPGTHIALLGETSYAWITSYFGVMTGSCVSVPLDAKLDSENLAAVFYAAVLQIYRLYSFRIHGAGCQQHCFMNNQYYYFSFHILFPTIE